MKVLLEFLLLASPAFAQLPAPPPTSTSHVPQLLTDGAKQSVDLALVIADWNAKENWITTSILTLDNSRVADEKDIASLKAAISMQSDTLGKFQAQLNDLNAKIAALQGGPAPPATVTPLHIEAESFTTSAPVATVQLAETSTINKNLCCLTSALTGVADYNVTIPADGNYTVTARTASTRAGITISFSAGAVSTGPIPVVNTGGWQTYTIITGNTPLALTAGATIIHMTYGQYANIDFFELSKAN